MVNGGMVTLAAGERMGAIGEQETHNKQTELNPECRKRRSAAEETVWCNEPTKKTALWLIQR